MALQLNETPFQQHTKHVLSSILFFIIFRTNSKRNTKNYKKGKLGGGAKFSKYAGSCSICVKMEATTKKNETKNENYDGKNDDGV